MPKDITVYNQNSKLTLDKTKSLLKIANNILTKSNRLISYNQNKIIKLEDNIKAWVDDETGLMWEVKNKNNIYTKYSTIKELEQYRDSINQEKYLEYSDWKIPTIRELDTIIDTKVIWINLLDNNLKLYKEVLNKYYKNAWEYLLNKFTNNGVFQLLNNDMVSTEHWNDPYNRECKPNCVNPPLI